MKQSHRGYLLLQQTTKDAQIIFFPSWNLNCVFSSSLSFFNTETPDLLEAIVGSDMSYNDGNLIFGQFKGRKKYNFSEMTNYLEPN